jgi:hypothetical protein
VTKVGKQNRLRWLKLPGYFREEGVRAMPPEITALIDKPWLLAALLAVGAIFGMGGERVAENMKKAERRAYWRGRHSVKGGKRKVVPFKGWEAPKADVAADQLKAVMRANFKPRPLLNKPEGQVFKSLDKMVIARNPKWQVMAQVSLGEFLASEDREAYACINSKRVDFALMDENCRVVHALEYQGSGHHTGDSAAARDAVKKEALRKAGIGYHEVVAGHTTPSELRALVERLVVGGR